MRRRPVRGPYFHKLYELGNIEVVNMYKETAKKERHCSFCNSMIKAENQCWKTREWGTVFYRQYCIVCGIKKIELTIMELTKELKQFKFQKRRQNEKDQSTENQHLQSSNV